MLKLIRIDDRLIHGQVAFTWTPALNINCIVVANDRAATDEFLKMTLGLAKPAGVKLVIKTIRETIPFLNDAKNAALSILVLIRELIEKGIELEVRQVPTDKKNGIESLLS